jgi:hypothetical protein
MQLATAVYSVSSVIMLSNSVTGMSNSGGGGGTNYPSQGQVVRMSTTRTTIKKFSPYVVVTRIGFSTMASIDLWNSRGAFAVLEKGSLFKMIQRQS